MSVLAIVILVAAAALGYLLFFRRPSQSPGGGAAGPDSEPVFASTDMTLQRRWHDVLGVSPSASVAELRAAYNKLNGGYAPEKLAALEGAARERAEMAAAELSLAYRRGLQVRGGEG